MNLTSRAMCAMIFHASDAIVHRPCVAHGLEIGGVAVASRRAVEPVQALGVVAIDAQRCLGVDVAVVLAHPCILCMETVWRITNGVINIQGGIRMTLTSRASAASASATASAYRSSLGVEVKVILTPPCILCTENH